ncbi:MAG: peptide ABC transporter substrate-binding protein [Gemmatimonadota bacterium]
MTLGLRWKLTRGSTHTVRFCLLGILAACSTSEGRPPAETGETGERSRFGGTAVVAYPVDMPTLGVLHTINFLAHQVQRDLLFMPLIRFSEELEPVPWLAERWDTVRVATDSLELTFHLRQDVRWHDGQPTTTDDVRFTFERVKDPRVGAVASRHFAFYSPKVEVDGPYTIRFRLRAYADFLEAWYSTPSLPHHLLGDVPPEALAAHPFGTRRPIGNGPFRVMNRVPGESWTFEANSEFPEALGGPPYLDRIVFRTVPDPTTLLTELATGAADLGYVSSSQMARLEGSRQVRGAGFPSSTMTLVFWNTRLPLFSESRVRRALTLALDRRAISDVLTDGRGPPGGATITPFHRDFEVANAAAALPHDIARSRRLLADTGWTRGEDGILRNLEGDPFRFTLTLSSANQPHADAAQIIQEQLRPLGVQVDIRQVGFNTLMQQLQQGPDAAEPLEALLFNILGEIRQDDSYFFHSRHLGEPGQIAGYSDPRMDALLDSLALTLDPGVARDLRVEYQTLMAQEAPATVLYYPPGLVALNTQLNGVRVDGLGLLTTASGWWIEDAARDATQP